MAGIGVKLNKIYSKNTITTNIVGFGYSAIITVAPMILVIGAVILMQLLLGFSKLDYFSREVYACTVLYIFVFGLLTTSPFNAVLSRYLSDVIYEEQYDDILPCYYVGLILNTVFSALLGIPFVIWEISVGKIDLIFIFAGFCGFMALVILFYSMLFLSICKDYARISLYFLFGMTLTVLLALVLAKLVGLDLKEDVIAFCNAVAQDLGYADLQFLVGDIADYDESAKADMVVTLHACDTATDFALQKARRWNAKVILSVPCCQHELNRQIRRPDMDAILGHGILRERFSAILTDALRADKLTEWGYKVDMIEFTSLEHTAKNIMLRCIAGKASPADRRKAQADFAKQCAYWHVSPTIGKE